MSRRGWAGASVVIGLEVAAITAGALGLHLLAALVMAALLLALMAAGFGCLALTIRLAVGQGERRDLAAQLAEATAEYDRLAGRNRQLGNQLSQARLDAAMLRADRATPELMAQVDDLPRRAPGACERELERWADLTRRPDWPVIPPHVDPPYEPTAKEVAAWDDLLTRLEASP